MKIVQILLPYGYTFDEMRPEVEKGDIVNLAPYHFYMKVATEDSEEAFSGQTVPLDMEESERVRKAVVTNSRKKYATSKAKVEEYMATLFEEGGKETATCCGQQESRV